MLLKVIKEIEKSVGNDKIEVMKAHPGLKKVLRYAYDPFKKYYISAPDLSGFSFGNMWMDEAYDMLDDLSTRRLSGQAAFEKVCDQIITMSTESAEVFKMILNKDLRCGINVKTINKAFPGLILLVYDGSEKPPFALCRTLDLKKVKYPCLAAVKKDGVRSQKIEKMISRQGKLLVGHDHIEDELERYAHGMDGELCIPGEIFDVASGLIRNDQPTPESVFWIFDSPSLPGTKLERYNKLENALPVYMTETRVALIKHHMVHNEEELMKFYNWAIEVAREEGIVIYDPDAQYEDGRIWGRLVPIQSSDCPVAGFYEGKGKHAGSLGGIIVDYKGHEVRVGTGFSEKVMKAQLKQLVSQIDKKLLTLKNKNIGNLSPSKVSPIWQKIRQFIWDNREGFMGVTAKLEYKEKTKAGSMRQPRFRTWRWDK